MNKAIAIGLALFANVNSANFSFAFCENDDESTCTRVDSIVEIESMNCNPESGKCKINAKCNESISFEKSYKESFNDSGYKLIIPSFDYTNCTKGERLLINAKCIKNGCIDYGEISFNDMYFSYISTEAMHKYRPKIEIKATANSSEYDLIIQSSEKEYYNPQMECSTTENGKILSRKVYRIDYLKNGEKYERIEMMKSRKQYRIINIALSEDWKKNTSISCITYEHNQDDTLSKYYIDEQ